MKIEDDKYYTPVRLAERLILKTKEVIGSEMITEFFEPSAGNGAFSSLIPDCVAYDLKPEADGIHQADFLELDLEYLPGRCFIGNPPFGERNILVERFYDKCCQCGDYIAFVLPISCMNNRIKLYKFDLIHSEDLGIQDYSGRMLHCCFNIYKRPEGGLLNEKPDFRLADVRILEYRRGKTWTGKKPDDGWCHAFCNWGNGSIGNVPEYVGQYAQEVYIYCDDPETARRIREVTTRERLLEEVSSISAKKISVMGLYRYLYESIPGLRLKKSAERIGLW